MQEFSAKGSFIQYGGIVDHALVVRGISSVYNKDYITDVILHLNGAIEVRAALPNQIVSCVCPSPLNSEHFTKHLNINPEPLNPKP